MTLVNFVYHDCRLTTAPEFNVQFSIPARYHFQLKCFLFIRNTFAIQANYRTIFQQFETHFESTWKSF